MAQPVLQDLKALLELKVRKALLDNVVRLV